MENTLKAKNKQVKNERRIITMDKNEDMLKEEFCKEMTGKSLKRVKLDKYLKKVLHTAIENTSEEDLGCLIAIGDFSDLHNIVISTGGFFDDNNVDELNQRWMLTLELIDGFITNLTKSNNELAHYKLKLFMNCLKEMIAMYEETHSQQEGQ